MPTSRNRGAQWHRYDWSIATFRVLMAVAYPLLSHLASTGDSAILAACALGTIVLMVLIDGLIQRRAGAWLMLVMSVLLLFLLARSDYAQLLLLLVPVVFVGLIAWGFGRTLRKGQVPLITRIVSALDARSPDAVAPALRRYTRNLTVIWAVVLIGLALCNLVLAMLATPVGLFTVIGVESPFPINDRQWSWLANTLNYGLVGGVFVIEYWYRKHCFPGRYRNFADFIRRLSALGPVFWRDMLR